MAHKKALIILSFACVIGIAQCKKDKPHENPEVENPELINEGKNIFRFDTFGDEDFWSGVLHIDKAIAGQKNGGFGPGISPKTALAVGLKVDAEALPPSVVSGITNGTINLDDPATTLALLKLNAVLGVKGNFSDEGELTSIGLTCASCHSTVDNSFAPGIGKRLDGWPNRDLNVGAIISLTDNAKPLTDMFHVDEPTLRQVLASWGPGKFPAVFFMDGKAYRPDGKTSATVLPAAFGLKGIKYATYTGWGSVKYWNSFVANLLMHGKGNFSDQRLNDPVKYPIAVENKFYTVTNPVDLITPKLNALEAYQFSLEAPKPPVGSYNVQMAARGKQLFAAKAKCASCHVPPRFTEPGNSLHTAAEIGIDDFEAKRSPTGRYRTTPLGGLFTRTKGGFYHDGRFAALPDVVNHYNNHFKLSLSEAEKRDLVEYLKSL